MKLPLTHNTDWMIPEISKIQSDGKVYNIRDNQAVHFKKSSVLPDWNPSYFGTFMYVENRGLYFGGSSSWEVLTKSCSRTYSTDEDPYLTQDGIDKLFS